MNKLSLIFAFCFLIGFFSQAQAPPNAFNYSAIARDPAGQAISSSTIGIQINILKTSITGAVQYSENHSVNTDEFGLFNLIIGGGAIQSGSMTSINWNNDNYYINVGMDVTGGTNFLTMGTSQLLSVPYAMHAATADSIIGGTTNFSGNYNDLINKPITVSSISSNGDTLFLSNGQFFVSGGNSNLNLPILTTNSVTNITSNGATFSAEIIDANGNQIMERGIVYSTSPNPTLNSGKISIGTGIGVFDTILSLGYNYEHLLIPNTTYYYRSYAVTDNNSSFYGNELSFITLPVGQISPSGGVVFFDKGNSNGGWRYLEVDPNDELSLAWGCNGTLIAGTELNVGQLDLGITGQTNTSLIVAACNEPTFAARFCDDFILGGATNWYLPSVDEFYLIYKNLHMNAQGGFGNSIYYTNMTSPTSGILAHVFLFDNGTTILSGKTTQHKLRPVRSF